MALGKGKCHGGAVDDQGGRSSGTPDGRWPRHSGRLALREVVVASLKRVEGLRTTFAPAVHAWRHGDLDGAIELLRPVCGSQDTGLRAVARILLADAYGVRGDLEDALLQLRLTADSGHPEIAPMAACVLGHRLEEHGDLDGAQRAYQQAVESGHHLHAARARRYLAELYFGMGEVTSALATLGTAEPMPAQIRGWAQALLGDFRFALGDLDGAYAAYQQAAETDPGDPGDRATVMLAALTDLGHGGLRAQEGFAQLRHSNEASAERSAFVRVTLQRWHGSPDGASIPGSVPVDERWLAYAEVAVQFHRDRPTGQPGPPSI